MKLLTHGANSRKIALVPVPRLKLKERGSGNVQELRQKEMRLRLSSFAAAQNASDLPTTRKYIQSS